MSDLFVIIVSGHVALNGGNPFFHDKPYFKNNHAECVKKAAELAGACTKVDDEPPLGTRAHWEWEQHWCVPGV